MLILYKMYFILITYEYVSYLKQNTLSLHCKELAY
jgi:hypothetical protein